MLEILKAIFLGIVEGVTEWLPVSSTGHMILVDQFLQLDASEAFKELFFVVIQFGAILAVLTVYWKRFIPLKKTKRGHTVADPQVFRLWLKIIIACVPAAVVGILFDDQLNALFYNFQTVGMALIVFGIAFIADGKRQWPAACPRHARERYHLQRCVHHWHVPADRGGFPPGTSRSGATILGGIAIGVGRAAAAEFTFFLAVPVMFGRQPAQVFQARLGLYRV